METKIIVNKENITVDVPEFSALVHQPGIRVDVPDFFEINSRNTIDCMEKMSQKAWIHISTGEIFQHLFKMVLPEIEIPSTIEELNNSDYGTIHICGIIVLCCESMFAGQKKVFFRNPENHLHPKTEQLLVGMLKEIQKIGESL